MAQSQSVIAFSLSQPTSGLDIQVFGLVEKRWGRLMCAHGYEGSIPPITLPDFPID